MAAACAAHAQEPQLVPGSQQVPPPQPPPPQATAPQAPAAAAAPTRPVSGVVQMTPEQLQRIYHIRQLEGVLTNAVKAGASTMAYQMQMAEANLYVSTTARARGFELEGYGVFFDVDVPSMLQSAVYSVQVRQEQLQNVDSLRAMAVDPKLHPAVRKMAEIELNRQQRILGLMPTPVSPPAAAPQAVAQGMVVAATADAGVAGEAARAAAGAPPVAPLPDLRDPNERYTEAIKEKLIDAMLNYGMALRLEDQEWFVIAARATSGDLLPGQLDDAASILLRIKGEDLNAYAQKKISRDEVSKRIEIKIG